MYGLDDVSDGGDHHVLPAEEAKIEGAIARVRRDTGAELRALFARLDVNVGEQATIQDMMRLMRTKLDPRAVEAAQRQIADERAGQEPALEVGSDVERIVRVLLGLGDQLERELAAEVGAERARELRIAHDGWETKMVSSLECEDDR